VEQGLAEQALELVKGDRGPNGFQKIRSLSHKNQAVFKKSARFIIFSRFFLVFNFKNCLRHNTQNF
jgi:hypothetical protein